MSSDPKLMDTEPGGESTQYESIQTVTKPHSKEDSQLSDPSGHTTANASATSEAQESKREKGEKTAEKIRFGESISEHGYGGEVTTNSGSGNQEGGYGGVQAGDRQDDSAGDTRQEQSYGPGSGVGG
ncbi:MAG: hypothetical protein M4579_005995 [Chaenotheca gracillima]|nr:MAG: hypothetical protein M4579_005995 [Chaenotheca gracillima]